MGGEGWALGVGQRADGTTTYKLALLLRHFVANKAAPGESSQNEPRAARQRKQNERKEWRPTRKKKKKKIKERKRQLNEASPHR